MLAQIILGFLHAGHGFLQIFLILISFSMVLVYFNGVSSDWYNMPGTNSQSGNDHLGIDSCLQHSSWVFCLLGMDFLRFLWFCMVFQWFWCISRVCLEIGTTCRGLIPKVETITWGLIPAGRGHPGCPFWCAWSSSDFFDFDLFFNGSCVFQWCALRLE